ncbi:MAG TPA: hypothetical protein VKU40_10955 [Thermoanaerobaculia bacterium]|nr:hypothetical protein [Thermoanaerobaculia bacterium]
MIAHLAAASPDATPAPGAHRLAAATGGEGTLAAVLARPLADPVARLLVDWSLVAGAALVLEPHPAALVPTAAWARPALFAGSGEEIGRLAAEAEAHERSYAAGWARRLLALFGHAPQPRRPFGRLRAIVEIAPAAGDGSESAFWNERGVERFTADELLA